MPDVLERTALFGAVPKAADFEEESFAAAIAKRIEQVVAITEEFQAKARELKQSKELTRKGREVRLAELGSGYLAKLHTLAPDREEFRKSLRWLEEKIEIQPREQVSERLTPREIRDRLLKLPEADRLTVFLRAIESGDEDTFFAVSEAPAWFELLPADTVEAGRQSWAERRNPEKAREVAEARRLLERFDNAVEMARQEIGAVAGVADPVAQVAASVAG